MAVIACLVGTLAATGPITGIHVDLFFLFSFSRMRSTRMGSRRWLSVGHVVLTLLRSGDRGGCTSMGFSDIGNYHEGTVDQRRWRLGGPRDRWWASGSYQWSDLLDDAQWRWHRGGLISVWEAREGFSHPPFPLHDDGRSVMAAALPLGWRQDLPTVMGMVVVLEQSVGAQCSVVVG